MKSNSYNEQQTAKNECKIVQKKVTPAICALITICHSVFLARSYGIGLRLKEKIGVWGRSDVVVCVAAIGVMLSLMKISLDWRRKQRGKRYKVEEVRYSRGEGKEANILRRHEDYYHERLKIEDELSATSKLWEQQKNELRSSGKRGNIFKKEISHESHIRRRRYQSEFSGTLLLMQNGSIPLEMEEAEEIGFAASGADDASDILSRASTSASDCSIASPLPTLPLGRLACNSNEFGATFGSMTMEYENGDSKVDTPTNGILYAEGAEKVVRTTWTLLFALYPCLILLIWRLLNDESRSLCRSLTLAGNMILGVRNLLTLWEFLAQRFLRVLNKPASSESCSFSPAFLLLPSVALYILVISISPESLRSSISLPRPFKPSNWSTQIHYYTADACLFGPLMLLIGTYTVTLGVCMLRPDLTRFQRRRRGSSAATEASTKTVRTTVVKSIITKENAKKASLGRRALPTHRHSNALTSPRSSLSVQLRRFKHNYPSGSLMRALSTQKILRSQTNPV